MNHPFIKILFIAALYFGCGQTILAQEQKYALIIGVKDYEYAPPLKNSLNDARDMAAALKDKGFVVQELYNPKTKREMQDAIRVYMNKLFGNTNATGLVFYSGHGIQVKGVNYFLPTATNLQIEADLDEHALKMEYLLSAVEQSGNALNIFILDACRNTPFRSFSRSTDQGLNQVNAPKGSYVVYATAPGSVASDGSGRNGLFTSKLLKYINTPNIALEQVFKYVARDVQQESQGSQIPWINYSYFGDFYFSGTTNTQPIVKTEPANVAPVSSSPSVTRGLDYGYGTVDALTVKVGQQEWFSKNLNVDRFANGDLIPEARTAEEWKNAVKNRQPAWCYYQDSSMIAKPNILKRTVKSTANLVRSVLKKDQENVPTYGKLYNWYAVNDPRTLAPKGWHVPSDAEWTALTTYLGGEALAGTSLKSNNGWDNDGNGNNISGITGLPGGYRNADGTFTNLGEDSYWWSSSEYNISNAWYRGLSGYDSKASRGTNTKSCGFSVRCLRD